MNVSHSCSHTSVEHGMPFHHFRSEKRTGAEMPHAIVSGIVAGEAPISYWPFFPASLETVPEVFAKLNASSFFLSLKWRQGSAE